MCSPHPLIRCSPVSEPNVTYNNLNATLVPFVVHGWKMLRRKMRAGQTYSIDVAHDTTDPLSTDNIALWVAGRVRAQTTAQAITPPDRVPGFFTLDRTFVPAGTHSFEVIEDTEWWCFTRQLNHGNLPNVAAIRLDAAASMQLPNGAKFVLCFGQYQVNGAPGAGLGVFGVSSQQATVRAQSPTYGFVFLE